MLLSMFCKCYPTNTSMPSGDDEVSGRNVGLSGLPAATQFATTGDDENTAPYSYIKEGNIEKILEGLRNKRYIAARVWPIVFKYPNSPALYLFVIAKLEMNEEVKDRLVSILVGKREAIRQELPDVVKQCFTILSERSAQEAWDYGTEVMNTLNIRPNIFHTAVVGGAEHQKYQSNDDWHSIFNVIARARYALATPTPQENTCCFPRRVGR